MVIRFVAAALCMSLLAACSAGGSPSTSAQGAAATATPSPPILSFAPLASPIPTPDGSPDTVGEVSVGPLAAGWWSYRAFHPSVVLRLPEGWQGGHMVDEFWDVNQRPNTPSTVAILVGLPVAAHSGITRSVRVDRSQEAITVLDSNPSLVVTNPQEVTIGGWTGHAADVRPAINALLPVFDSTTGTFHIGGGQKLRIAFLDTSSGLVAIGVDAPLAGFDATMQEVAPILASVHIAG